MDERHDVAQQIAFGTAGGASHGRADATCRLYQLSLSTDDTQNNCRRRVRACRRTAPTMPRSSYSKNAPMDDGNTITGGPAWPKLEELHVAVERRANTNGDTGDASAENYTEHVLNASVVDATRWPRSHHLPSARIRSRSRTALSRVVSAGRSEPVRPRARVRRAALACRLKRRRR